MLVLSRKQGEKIILTVGTVEIDIMVTEIHSDRVKIGIKAPPEVTINRQEVQDRMRRDEFNASYQQAVKRHETTDQESDKAGKR
jgi:carbon storage regulator